MVWDHGVAGSNPVFPIREFKGALAQLGERLLCTQEVSGSIPLGSIQIFIHTTNSNNPLNLREIPKVFLLPMKNGHAWRRSLKIAYHNKLIVEEANRRYHCAWLFLTLTVRNVEGGELRQTISDMMKGFNRLTKYKRFDAAVLGYFRALEITKNHEEHTYHPHIKSMFTIFQRIYTQKFS